MNTRTTPRRLIALALITCAAAASQAQTQKKPQPHKATIPAPAEWIDMAGDLRGGHDFMRLAVAASKLEPKGEFETTDDFRKRIAAAIDRPVYGTVSLSSRLIAIGWLSRSDSQMPGLNYSYNADAESMRVCVSDFAGDYGSPAIEGFSMWGAELPLHQEVKQLGSYIGSNAFGAKVRVKKSSATVTRLLVEASSPGSICTADVKVTRAEAKQVAERAMWAIVGHLAPPYYAVTATYTSPEISNPVEHMTTYRNLPFKMEQIALYDPRTGEILMVIDP